MKRKRIVSIILSILFAAAGITLLVAFFSAGNRTIIDIILGTSLLFLAAFNMIATIKYSRSEN